MARSRASRRRLALLCLLVVGVVAVVVASASGSSVWDVPAPAISDPSTWSRDPVWQRAQAQSMARDAAQQAALSSPSADHARQESETQFDDLSRPEAQGLAQQTFPDLMAAPVDALGLPHGDHVTSYVSPTQARVEDEQGKHFILMGSQPLAATDDGADALTKVDLSLSPQDGALVPANPAVDVQLPESAADPLTLPDSGLSVSMGTGTDVAGHVEDDRVFYGDVSTDTDYITVPRRDGAEVMWQLRSPQATESPSLDLDLPADEHARLTSMLTGAADDTNPSVEIVNDDNAIVDTIEAPIAVDADGVSVPAHYRLDGDHLYVDVPHREQAVRYPVMVDPAVHEVWNGNEWDGYGAGPYSVMAGQWGFTSSGGLGTRWFLNNATYAGRGLFIESWPGAYSTNEYAYFHWGVPGYVNISGVWFDGLYHQTEGDHLMAGTIGPYGWQTVYNIGYNTDYEQSSQSPSPAWENASALIGVYEDMSVNHPVPGWVGVRGVDILIGDTRPPDSVSVSALTVDGQSLSQLPRGADGIYNMPWVNGLQRVTMNTVAHDLGLGLYRLGLMTDGNDWIGTPWLSSCTGTRSGGCPQTMSHNQDVPLTRGYQNFRAAAFDVEENLTFGVRARLRVDDDSPKITLSGDAVDHRDDGDLGANPTITIDAKDDPTSSAGAAYDQSGVSQVVVSLDSSTNHIYTWNRPAGCADNCDAHFQLTLPATDSGPHRLYVVALDGTGHYGNYAEHSDPLDANSPMNGYLTFNIGASPDEVSSYDAMTFDMQPTSSDTDPNADQLPVSSNSPVTYGQATATSAAISSLTSSSRYGLTEGGATIGTGTAGEGCTANSTRDGFHIMQPEKGFHSDHQHTTSGVMQAYKQDKARRLTDPVTGRLYTTKQWILCAWSGTSTRGGYQVTQSAVGMWLRSSSNLLLQSTWSGGVTNGQNSTSMSFQVASGPVTIGATANATGDGHFTGKLGRWEDIDRWADRAKDPNDQHAKVDAFTRNMVTAIWTGRSPDYQATTGQALYEAPQSFANPRAESINLPRYRCARILGVGCAAP